MSCFHDVITRTAFATAAGLLFLVITFMLYGTRGSFFLEGKAALATNAFGRLHLDDQLGEHLFGDRSPYQPMDFLVDFCNLQELRSGLGLEQDPWSIVLPSLSQVHQTRTQMAPDTTTPRASDSATRTRMATDTTTQSK